VNTRDAVLQLFPLQRKPGLVLEGILVILIAGKFIRTKWRAEIDSPHYLVVFIRDGVWAFAGIFGPSSAWFRLFVFQFAITSPQ
jgi:hypothetical protein